MTWIPEFKPGIKFGFEWSTVPLSSQFWLTFGGKDPLLVALCMGWMYPLFPETKPLSAIAETTILSWPFPPTGNSGNPRHGSRWFWNNPAFLGSGNAILAPVLSRPIRFGMDDENGQNGYANWGQPGYWIEFLLRKSPRKKWWKTGGWKWTASENGINRAWPIPKWK